LQVVLTQQKKNSVWLNPIFSPSHKREMDQRKSSEKIAIPNQLIVENETESQRQSYIRTPVIAFLNAFFLIIASVLVCLNYFLNKNNCWKLLYLIWIKKYKIFKRWLHTQYTSSITLDITGNRNFGSSCEIGKERIHTILSFLCVMFPYAGITIVFFISIWWLVVIKHFFVKVLVILFMTELMQRGKILKQISRAEKVNVTNSFILNYLFLTVQTTWFRLKNSLKITLFSKYFIHGQNESIKQNGSGCECFFLHTGPD
jgi:hypothetical protein